MAISFNRIPRNLRLRLFWAEMDPTKAGTFVNSRRMLVMGHKLAGGSMATLDLNRLGNTDSAIRLGGIGSMFARSHAALRINNGFDDVWGVAVPEPAAGAAATGAIAITHAAVSRGVLSLYVAGQKITAAVGAGDSVQTQATALYNAINANPESPVAATAPTNGNIPLVCKWKGETGNKIDLRMNYRGLMGGEETPTGTTFTITPMSGGAGVPDLSPVYSLLGDQEFETYINPWTDSGSLDEIDYEMGDGDDGRWGWRRQLYGHVVSARDDTFAALSTFGGTRNGPHQSTWGLKGSPTPVWERSAAFAAQCHRALMNDPARPLGTLPLLGVLAPAPADRFTKAEQNALLYDGISVSDEMPDGSLAIQQVITHYQTNAYGLDDNSMLKWNTLATYAYVIRSLRARISSRFPRAKLANDGTRFGAGQAVVTPALAKAEIFAHYRELEYIGLLENSDAAMRNTICERDIDNPDRLNVLYTPDFVNQLDVFALVAQYRLQFAPDLGQAAVPLV